MLTTVGVFAASRDDDETVATRVRRHVKNAEAAQYALHELKRERERLDKSDADRQRAKRTTENDGQPRQRRSFEDDRGTDCSMRSSMTAGFLRSIRHGGSSSLTKSAFPGFRRVTPSRTWRIAFRSYVCSNTKSSKGT